MRKRAVALVALVAAVEALSWRRTRMRSSRWLTRRGDLDGLVRLLADKSWARRAGAARALRRFPGERTEAALLRALEDQSYVVSQQALRSLDALDADRDPEPVLRAFRRRSGRDEAPRPPDAKEIAEYGVWRLTRVEGAADEILKAVADRSLLAGDERWSATVNFTLAASALAELGDRRAVEPLARALADDERLVRRAAAGALGQLGGVEARRALEQFRSQGSLSERWVATRALRSSRARRERGAARRA